MSQILHSNEEPDPDTIANTPRCQVCVWIGVTQVLAKKVQQPFLPLQGPLETQLLQFLQPTLRDREASEARLTRF